MIGPQWIATPCNLWGGHLGRNPDSLRAAIHERGCAKFTPGKPGGASLDVGLLGTGIVILSARKAARTVSPKARLGGLLSRQPAKQHYGHVIPKLLLTRFGARPALGRAALPDLV